MDRKFEEMMINSQPHMVMYMNHAYIMDNMELMNTNICYILTYIWYIF